ncbi:MAG: hypothetical protein HQL32_16885, partial [Planctomycetes bacterium]|nr:hypothetical protein [Planctomycetota bacterium]
MKVLKYNRGRYAKSLTIKTVFKISGSILFLLLAMSLWGKDESPDAMSPVEKIIAQVHPKLNEIQKELESIPVKLEALPRLEPNNRSFSNGYHSALFFDSDHPLEIDIDLGKIQSIDAVVLIPAFIQTPLFKGEGYGFPQSFCVEVLDGPQSEARLLAEPSESEIQSWGAYPYLIKCKQSIKGRIIRIRTLKHWNTLEHWTTAFSEIMVLQGRKNIANGALVSSKEPRQLSLPGWHLSHFTDGQSPLGPPVSPITSPSNGILCNTNAKSPIKWITIDLGQAYKIEEIVLFPSRPTDFADNPGHGFPLSFQVQGSMESSFQDPHTFFKSQKGTDYPSPGDNPVTIAGTNTEFRFLRLIADKFFTSASRNVLSLSEFQIYSEGQNVALGKKVFSSDSFENESYPRWRPAAVVDGFNSQNKLIELPAWFNQLETRRLLEKRMEELFIQRAEGLAYTITVLAVLLVVAISVSLAFMFFLSVRSGLKRKTVILKLREQISQDLHDEIGSQLGGIALLTEGALMRTDLCDELRQDLVIINEVSTSTTESMRDIIWLTKTEESNINDLFTHLSSISRRMLSKTECHIEIKPKNIPTIPISLEMRRHLLLAYKEMVHNIRKHAEAKKVDIELSYESGSRQLSIKVSDDGVGFDMDSINRGYGLNNLEQRAKTLGGSLNISST